MLFATVLVVVTCPATTAVDSTDAEAHYPVRFRHPCGLLPPAELDAFVRKEIVRRAKVIKDNDIKSGD